MVVGQVPLRRAAEGGASTGGRALPGTLRPPRQPRPAARRRRQDAIGRRLRSGATPPPQPRPLVPLSLSLPIAHRKDRPICRQRLFQLMVSNCLFVFFFKEVAICHVRCSFSMRRPQNWRKQTFLIQRTVSRAGLKIPLEYALPRETSIEFHVPVFQSLNLTAGKPFLGLF